MSSQAVEPEEDEYVDVRTLPLRPPQRQIPAERAARRPWHPVMWDDTIVGGTAPDQTLTEEQQQTDATHEYPHKQRLRNLRRLIADGKVKPTSEDLIFFLCNKFAVSDERKTKVTL